MDQEDNLSFPHWLAKYNAIKESAKAAPSSEALKWDDELLKWEPRAMPDGWHPSHEQKSFIWTILEMHRLEAQARADAS